MSRGRKTAGPFDSRSSGLPSSPWRGVLKGRMCNCSAFLFPICDGVCHFAMGTSVLSVFCFGVLDYHLAIQKAPFLNPTSVQSS